MAKVTKVSKELHLLKDKINKIGGADGPNVVTLQILVPHSAENINKIRRFWISRQNGSFVKATRMFTGYNPKAGNSVPTRSLFYLCYDDKAFMYCSYKTNYIGGLSQKFKHDNDDVDVEERVINTLRNDANLNPFWNEWIKALKIKNHGQSTLWSCVRIPSSSANSSNKDLILSGYVIFNQPFDNESSGSEDTQTNLLKINRLIKETLIKIIKELYTEGLTRQATQAAISQVMARNMSHNIGSHVMNTLVNSEYLEKFCSLKDKLNCYKPKNDFPAFGDNAVFRQIAFYNDYIKCRMDYLADLTFGVPAMLINKKAYADIFLELDRVRLLLENISGRGDKFKYKITFKNNGDELNEQHDIILAIPNDVLGCQAFYNIIENIIRNTAKHGHFGDDNPNTVHEFTINLRDILGNEIKNKKDIQFEANSLYCVEIYDDIKIPNDGKLIKEQNNKINKEILGKDKHLRAESLGMVEMDASAAYLRQLDIVSIDEDRYRVEKNDKINNSSNHFNILKAFNASKKEGTTILGYRFFIKKPQVALIVSNNLGELDISALSRIGVIILGFEEFTTQIKNHSIFNHDFLVIDIELERKLEETIKAQSASLPNRIFFKDKTCVESLFKSNTEIAEALWKWREDELKKDYSNKKITLDITTNPRFIESEENFKDSGFANHMNTILEGCTSPQEIYDRWVNVTKNYFYYESLSTKAQNQLPTALDTNKNKVGINSYLGVLDKSYNLIAKVKVGESMLSRIIVIDERIQEKLKDKVQDIAFDEHYRMSNIFVPDKDCIDLKAREIKIEEIEAYIKLVIESTSKNIPFEFNHQYDFLLIHYSTLERAYAVLKDKDKNNKDRKTWINEWLNKYKREMTIVTTSGRGNIQGLPTGVRFVNLSSVTTALQEIKSKYLIHQILYSSRKNK